MDDTRVQHVDNYAAIETIVSLLTSSDLNNLRSGANTDNNPAFEDELALYHQRLNLVKMLMQSFNINHYDAIPYPVFQYQHQELNQSKGLPFWLLIHHPPEDSTHRAACKQYYGEVPNMFPNISKFKASIAKEYVDFYINSPFEPKDAFSLKMDIEDLIDKLKTSTNPQQVALDICNNLPDLSAELLVADKSHNSRREKTSMMEAFSELLYNIHEHVDFIETSKLNLGKLSVASIITLITGYACDVHSNNNFSAYDNLDKAIFPYHYSRDDLEAIGKVRDKAHKKFKNLFQALLKRRINLDNLNDPQTIANLIYYPEQAEAAEQEYLSPNLRAQTIMLASGFYSNQLLRLGYHLIENKTSFSHETQKDYQNTIEAMYAQLKYAPNGYANIIKNNFADLCGSALEDDANLPRLAQQFMFFLSLNTNNMDLFQFFDKERPGGKSRNDNPTDRPITATDKVKACHLLVKEALKQYSSGEVFTLCENSFQHRPVERISDFANHIINRGESHGTAQKKALSWGLDALACAQDMIVFNSYGTCLDLLIRRGQYTPRQEKRIMSVFDFMIQDYKHCPADEKLSHDAIYFAQNAFENFNIDSVSYHSQLLRKLVKHNIDLINPLNKYSDLSLMDKIKQLVERHPNKTEDLAEALIDVTTRETGSKRQTIIDNTL